MPRRSSRVKDNEYIKNLYSEFVLLSDADSEVIPNTYGEVAKNKDRVLWELAMGEEMDSGRKSDVDTC